MANGGNCLSSGISSPLALAEPAAASNTVKTGKNRRMVKPFRDSREDSSSYKTRLTRLSFTEQAEGEAVTGTLQALSSSPRYGVWAGNARRPEHATPTCARGKCKEPANRLLVLVPFGICRQLRRRASVNAQTRLRHKQRHGCERRGVLGVFLRAAGEMALERPGAVFLLPGQQIFLHAR